MQPYRSLHRAHIGKMHSWHRNLSLLSIVFTLGTGVTWFIAEDLLALDITELGLWVVLHGICGHFFLIILGMALYHHVQISWKMKKNRQLGAVVMVSAGLLILSILALYYGRGIVHEQAHWLHLLAGSMFFIGFFMYLYYGRKQ